MQAVMETIFDVVYLFTVVFTGILMLRKAGPRRQYKLFGAMAVLLGCGDAFHLIPRAWALCTTGLEANAAALGFGKFVTSITMTVFYVLLYHIWQERYHAPKNTALTGTVYALATVRIALCLLPQNQWLSYRAPLSWGIYRNIPFAILGILVIVLFFQKTRQTGDRPFWHMSLAVILSFGFYLPVVLFSGLYPLVGILMIPKTMAYVWIVMMGFLDMKKTALKAE